MHGAPRKKELDRILASGLIVKYLPVKLIMSWIDSKWTKTFVQKCPFSILSSRELGSQFDAYKLEIGVTAH